MTRRYALAVYVLAGHDSRVASHYLLQQHQRHIATQAFENLPVIIEDLFFGSHGSRASGHPIARKLNGKACLQRADQVAVQESNSCLGERHELQRRCAVVG